MGKNLIIVESPTKARTIGKFLGNKFEIKASMGHVRDLPKRSIGVDFENNFKPKYVTDRKKSKVIKELREAAKNANKVLLASDHDREGEAIAWHLAHILKKQIKDKELNRIIFNEITKKAIQKAINNPGKIDDDKVNAQQARRILDRIVGYKISPMLWRVIAKGLSAGRVQSVALRLICEREDEIEKFKPKEYWTIEAKLKREGLEGFNAKLIKWNKKKAEIPNKKSADEILAVIKNDDFVLNKIDRKKRKINPYPPYITSTLQQDAARILYFSSKSTMVLAQQLYEGVEIDGASTGLISYMRTDSKRISKEANAKCRQLVKERFGEKDLNKYTRVYKNKNSAQDAHEAIRPTDPFRTPESMSKYLNKRQLKLYTLIWQRFIATQMKPIELDSLSLSIEAAKGLFKANGSTIRSKGFLQVYPHINVSLGEKIDPKYAEKDKLIAEKVEGIQHFTKPPGRYSEASLIKELESKGIGRPSTYASIVSKILERDYVSKIKKKFQPTILGKTVNSFLVGHFDDLFNVRFTADMESELDKIEYGKEDWHRLLDEYVKKIMSLIEDTDVKKAKEELIETTDIKCEKCGSPMQIRWGKKGRFLGCSNFPKCKNIKNFTRDENNNIKVVEPEKLDEKCPECGGDLLIKEGRYGRFIACNNYPKCKYTRPFTLGIKCPDCEDGEFVEKKNRKGREFYGCSNYPKCKFITNKSGYYYMEERKNKSGKFYQCPKCKEKVYE